jgi:hypothetical protein
MYKVSFIGCALVKAIANSILKFVPLPNFFIFLHWLLQPSWDKVYVHKNALAKVLRGFTFESNGQSMVEVHFP